MDTADPVTSPAASTPPGKKTRRHQCQFCEKTFMRYEHRQRHERSHTKETPFRCSHCSKAFARK
ncbi:hypothetical protein QBC33DRAFT_553439 [Phialemonium atrogriseum]|uniref:C2H2-type domain-containing protein n=1 Tax=Phialemonium atrogriseum TaxID=1093897 RepID=A0AAJ0FC18_9PEZI|nr:uncharacterized protein QBC33DRAFT_553439 [Phialemonium atrogriseum]KAK1761682.1 hypothetical protein QBC33DRAFT_553439 [Phialemonium atrogriseum]